MEPAIPQGSYCLFGPETDGDREGKVLLVQQSGIHDPHAGGAWTVRHLEKVERTADNEEWTHDRILLSPDNQEYPAITLQLKSEEDLHVLGELVLVLPESDLALKDGDMEVATSLPE